MSPLSLRRTSDGTELQMSARTFDQLADYAQATGWGQAEAVRVGDTFVPVSERLRMSISRLTLGLGKPTRFDVNDANGVVAFLKPALAEAGAGIGNHKPRAVAAARQLARFVDSDPHGGAFSVMPGPGSFAASGTPVARVGGKAVWVGPRSYHFSATVGGMSLSRITHKNAKAKAKPKKKGRGYLVKLDPATGSYVRRCEPV